MLSHSKLGFGLMRLPKDENGVIDQTQVQTMVDLFMHNGFTYFDTAYAYAGSENAIREALVKTLPARYVYFSRQAAGMEIKRTRRCGTRLPGIHGSRRSRLFRLLFASQCRGKTLANV